GTQHRLDVVLSVGVLCATSSIVRLGYHSGKDVIGVRCPRSGRAAHARSALKRESKPRHSAQGVVVRLDRIEVAAGRSLPILHQVLTAKAIQGCERIAGGVTAIEAHGLLNRSRVESIGNIRLVSSGVRSRGWTPNVAGVIGITDVGCLSI